MIRLGFTYNSVFSLFSALVLSLNLSFSLGSEFSFGAAFSSCKVFPLLVCLGL